MEPKRGFGLAVNTARVMVVLAAAMAWSASPGQSARETEATDLFTALQGFDLRSILELAENPQNLSARDELGNTLLHAAVRDGQSFVVDILLAYGADPNAENSRGQTPIEMLAGKHKRSELPSKRRAAYAFVRHRLHPDPTGRQRQAELKLRIALGARDKQLARVAIDDGADPNMAIDGVGNTVLHGSLWTEMVPFVIELGGDVNYANKAGETPLSSALMRGDFKMTNILLAHGAAINDEPGESDLLLVIRRQSKSSDSIAGELLKAGATVRHEVWMSAMGTRNKNIVRRLWRHSPFDPSSTEGEALIAEAVRRGGDEVMMELRSNSQLANHLDDRESRLERSRDGQLQDFGRWLAPHLYVIVALIIGLALLSCPPAYLLLKGPVAYGIGVGASTAIMTHLFLFTSVIETGLIEFRFFGERVPSLRYFSYFVFDGAALLGGLVAAAFARRAVSSWVGKPLFTIVTSLLYIAALGVLVAHHRQTVHWPTAVYQQLTGYDDYVARKERERDEKRAARAAAVNEANARKASAPHAPLFRAVRDNDPAAVTAVLANGIPIGLRNEQGETALFAAASDGRRADVIPVLLAAGADVNAQHERGRRPVHALAANGIGPRDVNTMRLLIEAGADINARTDAGGTPLCSAHRSEHTEGSFAYFLWLVDQGATLKYSDRCATKVYAANQRRFLPLLKEAAGDINERRPFPKLDDKLGRYLATPLWQAAYQNRIEDAELLLDLGADIESRDTKWGMTPLQVLVHGFRYQPQRAEPLIELLLARGANPNALAWDGSRLLDCETTCRVETLF